MKYGAQVWAYFEIHEDGSPNYHLLDEHDFNESIMTPYSELWLCSGGCGEEFKDWEDALAHLEAK